MTRIVRLLQGCAILALSSFTLSSYAVWPPPAYSTYPCSQPSTNCQGGTTHDDLQVKGLERSARSTCQIVPGQFGGFCSGDFQGGPCPGSFQWCQAGKPPQIGSISHSAVSSSEIQLDVSYDFPNNYCQLGSPTDAWPIFFPPQNTRIQIVNGHETYAAFENGRWQPTIACTAGSVPFTITINATCGTQSVTQNYTVNECSPPVPPPTQHPPGCDVGGGAMGNGGVPIGAAGGLPTWPEGPVPGPLGPSLRYNGNNATSDSGLGTSWFFSYGETLTPAGTGQLVWTDSAGFMRIFTGSDASGYAASNPGDARGTVALTGGSYVLTTPDGLSRTFVTGANGFWVKTVDRWGNGAQGNTTTGVRATTVDELFGGLTTGRQITLGYSSGKLISITDVSAGITQIAYDATGRLQTICAADQTCPSGSPWRTFAYDGTSNRLASVTDAAGMTIRAYSYLGTSVDKTWVGATAYASGKERSQFVYAGSTVTLKREKGDGTTADTVYTYSAITGQYRVTNVSGACPECGAENSTVGFDASGFPNSRTDGNNNLTTRSYDSNGNVTQIVEASGTALQRTTTYVYAVPGTDAMPAAWGTGVTSFWKQKTEPSGVKPGSNVVTTRSWGGTGNLTLTESISGYLASTDTTATTRTTTTTYDGQGRVLSVDGPRTGVSDVTTFEFYTNAETTVANRNRLKQRTDSDLTVTTFDTYHPLGGLTQQTRKLRAGASDTDVVNQTGYDARGRATTATLLATAAAEQNLVTTNAFDTRGRLTSTQIAPSGGAITTRTEYAYEDGTDRLLTKTVTGSVGGPGDRITYGYDDRGNVNSETYGAFNGSTTTTDYQVTRAFDGRCRVKTQTYPADSASTQYGYDCVGNLGSVQDSLHASPNLAYQYDELSRLKQTTRTASPSNDITAYQYDARDSLTQVTDPNGNPTLYVYDDFGALRQKTTSLNGGSLGNVTDYTYDAANNMLSMADLERGTNRTYDAANRLATITNAAGSPALSITYTYDTGCLADPVSSNTFGQGRLCSVVDDSGTTTYGYDRRGLVVAETKAFSTGTGPFALGYRYDAAGRRTDTVYPNGDQIVSTLDPAGHAAGMTLTPSGGTAQTLVSSVTHKPFGPVTGFTTAGSAVESRSFDTRYRRMTQSTVTSGTTLVAYNYGNGSSPPTAYDKEGNLLALSDVTPGSGSTFNRTFSYDPDRYFLTSATGPFGSSYAGQTLTWTYDKTGNRLSENRSGFGTTAYGYGTDGTAHSNGVLTSVTPPGSGAISIISLSNGDLYEDDDVLHHSYDALGRLSRVTGTSCGPDPDLVNQGDFVHDAFGRRTGLSVYCSFTLQNPQEFVYGSDGQLLQRTTYGMPGLPQETDIFVWLEGEPIALVRSNDPSTSGTYFFHDDHLGRPVAMTDVSGSLTWRPEYEPFGKSLKPRLDFSNSPGFRFPGQWETPDSGDLKSKTGSLGRIRALTDNWHRTYVQRWGRYSQPDPFQTLDRTATAVFSYASNRPTGYSDPFGLFVIRGSCSKCSEGFGGDVDTGVAEACAYGRKPDCQSLTRKVGSLLGVPLEQCIRKNCDPKDRTLSIECEKSNLGCGSAEPPSDPKSIVLYSGHSNCPARTGLGFGPTVFHELATHFCLKPWRIEPWPDTKDANGRMIARLLDVCSGFVHTTPGGR